MTCVLTRIGAAAVGLALGMPGALIPAASAQGVGVGATLAQANQALQAGEADKSLGLLNSLPQGGRDLAEAQNLACRVHYALEDWNQAADECEQAVQLEAGNSVYHDWLGRALGAKADRASFLTAYSLGKRVRVEFETAAQLDPRNREALSDVGEFYEEAPGIVGGGIDKAEQVAAQLERLDGARAHELLAEIAEHRKDYGTAEREWKAAIARAQHQAPYWASLAGFYRRRGQWEEMESAIHSAVSAEERDKRSPVALYDGAGLLIVTHRDPGLAAKMLEDYLASPFKTEEGPAFEAHLRLARLKKQLGDEAGAQRELAAALALAHNYKPALDERL